MNNEFVIELIGDVDLKGMAVEVSYRNQTVAILSYENGIEKAEIELCPDNDQNSKYHFLLNNFFNALEQAKKLLARCAEEDKDLDNDKDKVQ